MLEHFNISCDDADEEMSDNGAVQFDGIIWDSRERGVLSKFDCTSSPLEITVDL